MRLVTVKQMREIERITIEEIGVPSIILMENAAMEAARHCIHYLEKNGKRRVSVVVGPGNNGGDGLALARRLFLAGFYVEVIFVGDVSALTADARTNLNIVQNLNIPIGRIEEIANCDLIVDALFGTGLSRPLSGQFAQLVDRINRNASYVISLDIPSGINSDTGKVIGTAVRADKTVVFGLPKQGLYLFPGAEHAGEIEIVDIGIPEVAVSRIEPDMEILSREDAKKLLPVRTVRSNKGSYGRIYILSGNKEMTGAPVLAATAAYKVGGGLVKACVPESVASVIKAVIPEAVMAILPDENGFLYKGSFDYIKDELSDADVLILGPGLGWNNSTREFVREVLDCAKAPLVLDADALNIISENVDILKTLRVPAVITPHPGEMSRLTGLPVKDILDNTVETAKDFAKRFNVVTVLKDAHSITATPDGRVCINVTGTPALAKAGSGDVLAGLIGSFMAQGLDVFAAAKLANYLHGDAGRLAEQSQSVYGVTATDLLQSIPKTLCEYMRCEYAF